MAITDYMFAAVSLFAVFIVFGVVYAVSESIFPALEDKLATDNPVVNQTLQDSQAVFPLFDTMGAFIFFGVMIAVLIMAFLLPTTPMAVGITVIPMIVVFLVTPALTNTYMEIATSLPNLVVQTEFPMTYFIMENYPLMVMGFGFTMFIILFARFKLGGVDR